VESRSPTVVSCPKKSANQVGTEGDGESEGHESLTARPILGWELRTRNRTDLGGSEEYVYFEGYG